MFRSRFVIVEMAKWAHHILGSKPRVGGGRKQASNSASRIRSNGLICTTRLSNLGQTSVILANGRISWLRLPQSQWGRGAGKGYVSLLAMSVNKAGASCGVDIPRISLRVGLFSLLGVNGFLLTLLSFVAALGSCHLFSHRLNLGYSAVVARRVDRKRRQTQQ